MWNAFIMRSGFYCCTHNKQATLDVGARTIWFDWIGLFFSFKLSAKTTNRFQTIITATLFVYCAQISFEIECNHLISSKLLNRYHSSRMTNRKVPQHSMPKTESNNNNNGNKNNSNSCSSMKIAIMEYVMHKMFR